MNGKLLIPLLAVVAVGCSAPQPFVAVTGGEEKPVQKGSQLMRVQEVAQFQVDAASVYSQMIEYLSVAGENAAPGRPAEVVAPVTRKLEAALAFRPGSDRLQPAYGNNAAELSRIRQELAVLTAGGGEVAADAGIRLYEVSIMGYASPDGSTPQNEQLAVGRAWQFSAYLRRELSLPTRQIRVEGGREDWEGLSRLAAENRKPYAARLDSVLRAVADPDGRRAALKQLDKGRVWKDMEQTLFGRLRRMTLEVTYEIGEPSAPQTPSKQAQATVNEASLPRLLSLLENDPEKLSLEELLSMACLYRPGTEQYREVYELAAYRFPDCIPAQLNAGAAALSDGDVTAARFFLERVKDDPRALINTGVLCLMEGSREQAEASFRRALPLRPRLARRNLEMMEQFGND